jgi:D-threonate/D-erythronate kinase
LPLSASPALVIADDLTGALEAGALYAAAGLKSSVHITRRLPGPGGADAIVLDIETRHTDSDRAAAIMTGVLGEARGQGLSYIYVKFDSTLRGPIAAQIQAVFTVWPERSVIFVPAYPRVGRIVRNGLLYVNGTPLAETAFAHDPHDPVRSSLVAAKLNAPLSGLIMPDVESQTALKRIAADIAARRDSYICAGSAGLLEELIRIDSGVLARSGLIVNGSLNAVSHDQCQAAKSELDVINLDSDARDREIQERIERSIQTHQWAVLSTSPAVSDAQAIVERLACIAAAAISRTTIDSVTVFGGDTGAHLLAKLGVKTIHPIRELLPGIPVSRIEAAGRKLLLATKAGGFGDIDVIRQIRSALGAED